MEAEGRYCWSNLNPSRRPERNLRRPTQAGPANATLSKTDLVVHEAEPTLMGGNLRLRRRERVTKRWRAMGHRWGARGSRT
jgi:hypothetical protein